MLEPHDLEQIRQIVTQTVTQTVTQIVTQIVIDSETRMTAQISKSIYDSETKLLTAFHKWASPFEARQRAHREAIRALDVEYESLDDRVKKLEDPPAA